MVPRTARGTQRRRPGAVATSSPGATHEVERARRERRGRSGGDAIRRSGAGGARASCVGTGGATHTAASARRAGGLRRPPLRRDSRRARERKHAACMYVYGRMKWDRRERRCPVHVSKSLTLMRLSQATLHSSAPHAAPATRASQFTRSATSKNMSAARSRTWLGRASCDS